MFFSVEDPVSGQNPLMLDVMNSDMLGSPLPISAITDVDVVPDQSLDPTISDLEDEVSALKFKQRYLDTKRREALNKILDIKGSIRVFCRVRASLPVDKKKTQSLISTGSEKVVVSSAGGNKEFCVDKAFPQESTQEEVFIEVEPILRYALDGHNVCIFAYGQTGTGKTFTMEGTAEKPGIVPRAIKGLFRVSGVKQASSFRFSMSMLEVYMGSLRDLLAQKMHTSKAMPFTAKSNLNVQSGSHGTVAVEGLTDVPVDDFKQAYRWYARGKRARSTSWTNVNEASSRSHCLTRITIGLPINGGEGTKVISKLWMVDLGGSERLSKTGATGQTMDEGKAINLSLSSLGDVISALQRKRNHVPYRNSKLTQILSDSLGNGSKVMMLVHVSPNEDDVSETICSLNFSKRTRASEFHKELSEDLKKQKEDHIVELNLHIRDIEEELEKLRNQIQITECLIHQKKRHAEDQKGSPRSPLIMDTGDSSDSPRSSEKTGVKNHHLHHMSSSPLPRFMTSTVCSRQRHSASGEISSRVKAVRTGTITSIHNLLGSQSRSFSDHFSKSNIQNMKTKMPKSQTSISKIRELSSLSVNAGCQSLDLKSSPVTRIGRVMPTSQPGLIVAGNHHRRRMSDFT